MTSFLVTGPGRVLEAPVRRGEDGEACPGPALLADVRQTGICGNYRVLAFQTQGKGWVKVQLIPFKEKKNLPL